RVDHQIPKRPVVVEEKIVDVADLAVQCVDVEPFDFTEFVQHDESSRNCGVQRMDQFPAGSPALGTAPGGSAERDAKVAAAVASAGARPLRTRPRSADWDSARRPAGPRSCA